MGKHVNLISVSCFHHMQKMKQVESVNQFETEIEIVLVTLVVLVIAVVILLVWMIRNKNEK